MIYFVNLSLKSAAEHEIRNQYWKKFLKGALLAVA